MKIKSVCLITGSGPDTLIITVDLPNGCYPFTGDASVKMDVAAQSGEEYCRVNFSGIPVKIVKTS